MTGLAALREAAAAALVPLGVEVVDAVERLAAAVAAGGHLPLERRGVT